MALDYLKTFPNTNNSDKFTDQTITSDIPYIDPIEKYNFYKTAEAETFFANTINLTVAYIKENFPGVNILCSGRKKSENSYTQKIALQEQDGKIPNIFDIFAFKIIINDVDDNFKSNNDNIEYEQSLVNRSKEHLELASTILNDARSKYDKMNAKLIKTANFLSISLENLQETYTHTEEQIATLNIDISEANTKLKALFENSDISTDENNLEFTNLIGYISTSLNKITSLNISLNNTSVELEEIQKNYNLIQDEISKNNNNEELSNLEKNYSNSELDLKKAADRLHIEISKEIADSLRKPNSTFLESLESLNIEDRYKHYNKPNGYISYQMTIGSKDCPYKTIEIQLRSEYRDELAAHNHIDKKGKQRDFPSEALKNCNTQEDFEELLKSVPTYYLADIHNTTIRVSPFNCFFHFYNKHLLLKDKDGNYVNQDDLDNLNNNKFFNDTNHKTILNPASVIGDAKSLNLDKNFQDDYEL